MDEISSAAGISQSHLRNGGFGKGVRNINNSIIDRINTAAVGGRSHLGIRLNSQSSMSGHA